MRKDEPKNSAHCPLRREVLRLAFGAAASSVAMPKAIADPQTFLSPQVGDLFVATSSPKMIVRPGDLRAGGSPILAWPMDTRTRVVRNGSRVNQILLLRLEPEARVGSSVAADGIAAFSALCTHAGCAVSEWKPLTRHLLCPCHGSEYDPYEGAKVVFGPAPRPLPALGVTVIDGTLQVASGFKDRLGGSTSRTD